jgi:hypothetical protein
MTYIGLDTKEHERSAPTGGTPLPAGLYNGVVTRTQLKDTKDGTGKYLEVEFDISSPAEFSNRKFWDRFNLINKNQDAVRIAKEQLADLAKAAGLDVLTDDTDLHGKEVTLILKVRPASGNFQASNECEKYWSVGTTIEDHEAWRKSAKKGAGSAPAPQKAGWGKPAETAKETAPPAQPAASSKPWVRKQ